MGSLETNWTIVWRIWGKYICDLTCERATKLYLKTKYEGDDTEGFVEAYLAAIELQKTHNQASTVSIELHIPPEVFVN